MKIIDRRDYRSGQGPWLYRMVYRTVRKLSPEYTLYGIEKLPETPCVLIGNHCHMYGPIAAEIYMPRPHYVWCIGEMMNRKELPDYALMDFWSEKPRATQWLYRLFGCLIAPLAAFVMNNAHTIPVYHDARVMTTFRQSITCLQNGMDVVIFPEKNEPYNGILWQFHEHFPELGRMYYQKTGSPVHFVPMYIAPKLKGIWYGDPVLYDPQKPVQEEKKRIRGLMMTAISDMAGALPRHTVVPYPNIPGSRYPLNTDCVSGGNTGSRETNTSAD